VGTVQVRAQDDVTVVSLLGEHDLATLGRVEAALAAAVARGLRVVIDLSPCEFIDCAIAGAFSGLDGATTSIVVGPATPASVRRLLDLLRVPFASQAGIGRDPLVAALG
jgi:anti-anti-sigma regulatory factor